MTQLDLDLIYEEILRTTEAIRVITRLLQDAWQVTELLNIQRVCATVNLSMSTINDNRWVIYDLITQYELVYSSR